MPPTDDRTLPSSDAGDILAGTAYRTLAVLDRGGMGQVLDAEHVPLARRVVVKIVRTDACVPQGDERLRLEAQALARLSHPHLVQVLDFGSTRSGRPFLVLERLWGRTLHDELRERGALPWEEAVRYAREALAALEEAHRAGLVHRDVKLQNIFLCDALAAGEVRHVKLLDFGIAKVIHEGGGRAPAPLSVPTEQGLVPGTPRFFAPEQAMGMPVDARADVYAMGVVLFYLLTGHGPFPQAKDPAAVAVAHVKEPPRPPSAFAARPIPAALDAAVLRALAKRPAERFATAGEMAEALSTQRLEPAAPSAPAARDATAPEASLTASSEDEKGLRFAWIFVLAGAVLCSAATTLAVVWCLR